MALSNATSLLSRKEFWGPVTATLDWCEANYQFSRYVAEAANTFSNIFTVSLACYGARQAILESLPSRYLVGYAGFALVGVGSFIFHATLLFEAQLADELPMIYVVTYCCAILCDTQRGFSFRNSNALPLSIAFFLFNILFTWSYMVWRNPIYHQVVFAILMISTAFRTAYLLRDEEIQKRVPGSERSAVARVFTSGAVIFAFGFFVWNMDNIFCNTAIGTYLMLVGNTYLTLCIKDDYHNYALTSACGMTHIARVAKSKMLFTVV
ncbi:Alkaline ceramidase 3 [Grifola frondosa]|uniref:Alkaline ceramidase 3 n=1 Tax=Grifola frondosa TaxID=5627 RepID=A0A1C7MT63_GRIFR|nr:Alkaline ceramidase 3 [Grifola frondosa]